jgi:hypothetical protein
MWKFQGFRLVIPERSVQLRDGCANNLINYCIQTLYFDCPGRGAIGEGEGITGENRWDFAENGPLDVGGARE